MTNQNKNLYYLHELVDYQVAEGYADVRDWEVVFSDNQSIGRVDGLLVSKRAERVVYLDVEVNDSLIEAGHKTYAIPADKGVHEFLNEDGENHLIIPIGLATLDENSKKVRINEIDYPTLAKTKRFKKGVDVERSYELKVLPQYIPGYKLIEGPNSDDEFYDRKEFK